MSDQDFLKEKGNALNKLDGYITKLSSSKMKNSLLLCRWISTYTSMLKREAGFDSRYMPAYKQGSIVFADLGYRIGSEHGGLHYVIVLDKQDTKSSSVLTVLPMSSMKGKTPEQLHPNFNYYLGDEFYNTLEVKMLGLFESFKKELEVLREDVKNEEPTIDRKKQVITIKNNQKNLQKCMEKARSLKSGGYAVVNQITTISKIRIKEPTKINDPLYNVVLSKETMNQINEKIIENYL